MACPRATFWALSKPLLVLLAPSARVILDSLEHAGCLLCLWGTSWAQDPAVAAAKHRFMLKQAAGRLCRGLAQAGPQLLLCSNLEHVQPSTVASICRTSPTIDNMLEYVL